MSEEQEPRRLWIEQPVARGFINGAVFALALAVVNVMGWFGPAVPLSADSITEYLFAGVIFGFVLYVLQLFKEQRRKKAEALARSKEEAQDTPSEAHEADETTLDRDSTSDDASGGKDHDRRDGGSSV